MPWKNCFSSGPNVKFLFLGLTRKAKLYLQLANGTQTVILRYSLTRSFPFLTKQFAKFPQADQTPIMNSSSQTNINNLHPCLDRWMFGDKVKSGKLSKIRIIFGK